MQLDNNPYYGIKHFDISSDVIALNVIVPLHLLKDAEEFVKQRAYFLKILRSVNYCKKLFL